LNTWQGEGAPPPPDIPQAASLAEVAAGLSLQHGLPAFLLEALLPLLGRAGVTALCEALDTPAPTWLRLNPLRGSYAEALAALQADGAVLAEASPSQALPAVRLLSGHPFAGQAYRRGLFTAQDLGAQLVARLLLADSEHGPLTLPDGPLLDACCGTGGKATHLRALLQEAGPARFGARAIDAADQSLRKLALCQEHLQRLGCRDVRPLQVDLLQPAAIERQLAPAYAAILLDAPCSGSGVLRRHPEARSRLTPAGVAALAETQRRILEALLPRLRPGGVLVYAVCSPLPSEGAELLAAVLAAHPELRPLPPAASPPWSEVSRGQPAALYTFPHEHNADAFYALRLVRVATATAA
jgi:16S rRNA (cytosine967-C5)-methyltransferase